MELWIVIGLMLGLSAQAPLRLSSIFDDATARELMQLRRRFDEAELGAIREFDAAVGTAAAKVAIPAESYRKQLATPELGRQAWTPEQRRRAARAWPIRLKKIDEAEAVLTGRTLVILQRFGFKEHDLPPIRRRKWAGPAVIGFNGPGPTRSPESRALLREVHRLWNLSTRQAS
jgi:hypothetical protein